MKKRILIVDDNQSILKMYAKILEKENRDIHTASSGIEALNLVKALTFDLILLDLNMPEMNGTETLRGIREIDQHVAVYFVTAFQNEFADELKKLKKDGISFEILDKPLEKKQINFAVESALCGPLAEQQIDNTAK